MSGGARKTASAMSRALRILDGRDHSRRQLEQKLLDRNFDADEVEQVLTKLVDLSYLDDSRFARSLAQHRVLRSLRGFADARMKLRQAGLDDKLIEETLEDLREKEDEKEICMKAARNKARKLHVTDREKWRAKMVLHLKGRGFPAAMIRETVLKLDRMYPDICNEE